MEALINCRRNKSKILVITGSEKSGKDQIISAMQDLAKNKTIIIKKHTSRNAMLDDGEEMICANVIDFDKSTEEKIVYKPNPNYNLEECNLKYMRRGNVYGLKTLEIWEGLQKGMFQVIALSNAEAINKLIKMFGDLVVLIYVHSGIPCSDYDSAFSLYINNTVKYNHVIIFEDKKEDLYDQVFRILHHYEV